MIRARRHRKPYPVQPRIPDTMQRAQLARERGIRQIVFGVQDGVLTTLGIVAGVGSATSDHATILLTGLVAIVVGALSMGVGEYTGGRTERQVLERALAQERDEMREKPHDEWNEQVGFYRQKGFTRDEAEMIVRRLEQNPDIWLHEMMRDEFGVDPRDIEENGIRPAVAMGASFAAGGVVPMLPYFVVPHPHALLCLACAALALFGIGWRAGRLSGRSPIKKGLEVVAVGAMVFVASIVAGHIIPSLFGHPPIVAAG